MSKETAKTSPAAMQMMSTLNPRHRRFVEAYMGKAKGRAAEAARLAGYKHPNVQGVRLLGNARISTAIKEITQAVTDAAILDREGLQKFWTEVSQEPTAKMTDRLAASKLLGKSQGQFLDRHEHSVDASVKAMLESTPQDIEDRVVAAMQAEPELWERMKDRVEGVVSVVSVASIASIASIASVAGEEAEEKK